MTNEIHEQLTKYLTDAHSIEEQALAQLRTAPKLAGDPVLADAYRRKFGGDHIDDVVASVRAYEERIGFIRP